MSLIYRSSRVFRVQIHPVRPRGRGVAVFVAACARKQGSAEKGAEGEAAGAQGTDPSSPVLPALLQA